MFLEKPAFLPVLDYTIAENKVSHLLKSKNWSSFSFQHSDDSSDKGKIFYAPFYFFSYVVHSESSGKTEIVSQGYNALNLFSNKFEKHISNVWHSDTSKKSNFVEDGSVTILPSRISEAEAKKIIPIYVAASNNVSKENVVVSGFEMYYVPIFVVDVKVSGKLFSFRINAVDGHIINEAEITEREKDFSETINELVGELSSPKGWFDNLFSLFPRSSGLGRVSGNSSPKLNSFFKNLSPQDMLVLALAVLAIILMLAVAHKF